MSSLILEESWVLGIDIAPRDIAIRFDFALAPDHPLYSPHHPGEVECYRRGSMIFGGVRRLEWSNSGGEPARDSTGELDWDHPVICDVSDSAARVVSELGDINISYCGDFSIVFHDQKQKRPDVRRLAQVILEGDDSIRAANKLERAIALEGRDVPEELIDVLSLYRPGEGLPYADYCELCGVLRRTLLDVGEDADPEEPS